MRRIVFSAIVAAIVCVVKAQDISLNGEWQFSVDNQQWQTVSVPHTYNIMDGLEDYAGEAVYRRTLPITPDPSLVLDLPTWNDYLGSWHGPDQTLLPIQLARLDSAFAGRPLFITEAGLCEPAFTGGDARRVNDMCYHISEWQKQDFICGYIYFCLQDYRTQMGEEGLYKHRIRRHGVNGTMQTIVLPDMRPGETYPQFLKNVNTRYAFEIFRPDGTSVIAY